MTQDVNLTYIRSSEGIQDAFWTFYERSTFVLCPGVLLNIIKMFSRVNIVDSIAKLSKYPYVNEVTEKAAFQFMKYRSSRPEVFCKKGVLRNFSKLTEKHLCQSFFFNKVAALGLQLHLTLS